MPRFKLPIISIPTRNSCRRATDPEDHLRQPSRDTSASTLLSSRPPLRRLSFAPDVPLVTSLQTRASVSDWSSAHFHTSSKADEHPWLVRQHEAHGLRTLLQLLSVHTVSCASISFAIEAGQPHQQCMRQPIWNPLLLSQNCVCHQV